MTHYGDYYYCEVCGHVVSIVHEGMPTLVCCGLKMIRLEANTKDAAVEKHVPVIEAKGNKTTIKVGSAAHPMTAEHHICFIEVFRKDGQSLRAKLEPAGAPEATFDVTVGDIEAVYEYCNLHGLWKAQK